MSTRWDCACFCPNRDIKFLGFGVFRRHNGEPIVYEVKWRIKDEDSDVYEFDSAEKEADEDCPQSMTVDIRQFGCPPVKVETGS